jgi:hypothetical protein
MKCLIVLTVCLISVFLVGFTTSSFSQSPPLDEQYKTAVGLKFYPGAFTIKHFIEKNKAVEGLGYFWYYGLRFTALYEIHNDVSGVEGLKWYIGPGAHIGVWNTTWKNRYPSRVSSAAIGVDGVIGLDYKFSEAPINISLDWQPSFNVVGYTYFEAGWAGLAVRYTLK